MIQNFKNVKNKGGYSQEIASRYVGPELPFVYVTEKPEPIHFYDQGMKKYTDDIVGYRIYVSQNYGDYVQNPIEVRINSKLPNNLHFGQEIRLKNLQACNVRNSDGFSKTYFKAGKIEVLDEK